MSREDLASKQKMDPQLQELVQEAVNVSESPYKLVNDLLVRPVTNDYGETVDLVVVPKELRKIVFETAHRHPLAGHHGSKKTKKKVASSFYS